MSSTQSQKQRSPNGASGTASAKKPAQTLKKPSRPSDQSTSGKIPVSAPAASHSAAKKQQNSVRTKKRIVSNEERSSSDADENLNNNPFQTQAFDISNEEVLEGETGKKVLFFLFDFGQF